MEAQKDLATLKLFLGSRCVQDTLWRIIEGSETVRSQGNDLMTHIREELMTTLEKLFQGEGLQDRELEYIETMLNDARIMTELLWYGQAVVAQHDTGSFSKATYYKIGIIK